MKVLRLIIALVLALILGGAVIFCILKVSDLNARASVLEACMTANNQLATACAGYPATAGEVSSLRSAANTLGNVGWVSVFLLLFVVGDALMGLIRGESRSTTES